MSPTAGIFCIGWLLTTRVKTTVRCIPSSLLDAQVAISVPRLGSEVLNFYLSGSASPCHRVGMTIGRGKIGRRIYDGVSYGFFLSGWADRCRFVGVRLHLEAITPAELTGYTPSECRSSSLQLAWHEYGLACGFGCLGLTRENRGTAKSS
jgi:hypothetical protein